MKLLHYPADARTILFILLTLGLYGLEWSGRLRHPLLYTASFGLAFLACVINHNHQHHPTFVLRPLNGLFSVLISLAIGIPGTTIVAMHNHNHHVHNNGPRDFVRASLVGFRWNLLNLLLFPLAAVAGYARSKAQAVRAWRRQHPRLYRQVILERAVFYPILLALLVSGPAETLVYLVLPYVFGQWGILAINHLQHDGCDPESTYNHARNFVGPWLNWWVFNNGYHTAHHLRPGLHWSLLPQLHAEIQDRIDPALQRRSLLLSALEFYLWPGRRPVYKGAS